MEFTQKQQQQQQKRTNKNQKSKVKRNENHANFSSIQNPGKKLIFTKLRLIDCQNSTH